jgi:hypothetical protein
MITIILIQLKKIKKNINNNKCEEETDLVSTGSLISK